MPKRPLKAWERDHQDKDTWFRKKYAHIHKQQKRREKPTSIKYNNNNTRNSINKTYRINQSISQNPLIEYIYGTNSILAALSNDKRSFSTRLLYHGNLDKNISIKAKEKNISILQVDKHKLNLLTHNAVHNNIVLETKPIKPLELSQLLDINSEDGYFLATQRLNINNFEQIKINFNNKGKKFPLGIYLDQIMDPYNMGAIIRSSVFLGADFICISRNNSCGLTPIVSKVSCGGIETIPIFTIDKPLDFMNRTKQDESDVNNWLFVSSSLNHKSKKIQNASDINGICNYNGVILVVGNEGKGIRKNIQDRSDIIVKIDPYTDTKTDNNLVNSLNVSVATGILINEILK